LCVCLFSGGSMWSLILRPSCFDKNRTCEKPVVFVIVIIYTYTHGFKMCIVCRADVCIEILVVIIHIIFDRDATTSHEFCSLGELCLRGQFKNTWKMTHAKIVNSQWCLTILQLDGFQIAKAPSRF
jgi:hypothetical protein